MSHYKNTSGQTAIILTFLFPFAGLVYSLANWRESWAKNAFWLACIYLGAVLIYLPEGAILGEEADGGRYVMGLLEMYGSSISLKDIFGLYLKEENYMDLYYPLVSFLVSRFTDNGHVLFAVFAFVFGFFYSRNMWYILEKFPNKKLGFSVILITLFFLINPITNINGVRYNTAIHVFVYAMMPYLLERDKSKLWWLMTVPLIHFSFLYVVILAFVYILLPYRLKSRNQLFLTVSLLLFIFSMFLNIGNLTDVNEMLKDYSPESYENRIDAYTNEDYADAITHLNAATNWYVGGSGIVKGWCYNLLLILIYPCVKRNFMNNESLRNLYVFTLVFGVFANLITLIPSGGRFQTIAQMFKVSLILLVSMNISPKDVFIKYYNVALVFLILPFVFEIRCLFDYFGITAIMGNFITVFFWENNIPLIDFIKSVI